MSTSKHFDLICIVAAILCVVLTGFLLYGKSLDAEAAKQTSLGYENRIFDTSKVHKIDIVMNNWDEFIAGCEDEEYVDCTLVIDGEKVSHVAIRAKGNTSLSSVRQMDSERYSFKLEFDHYQEGRTYYGLDKLCLNNLIQDNTMMKDYLVYRMMAEFGADGPMCSYAYLTVNGEEWGLYLAVEAVEDSFLTRNYGAKQGDLYKPDSTGMGGGRGNGKDFDMEKWSEEAETAVGEQLQPGHRQNRSENRQHQDGAETPENVPKGMPGQRFGGMFGGMPGEIQGEMPEGIQDGMFGRGSEDTKLKYIDDDPKSYSNIFDNAKTDVTNRDKDRLIASLKNLTNYVNLENVVDIDEVLNYFVIHNFVVNGDSYTGSIIHNYYLYEEDGMLRMIPWDYNLAFGSFQGASAANAVNNSIDEPVSGSVDDRPMVGWIFSDEKYTAEYHARFTEFIEQWLDNGKLEQMVAETEDMIRPYVEKDPTKFCTAEEFEKGVIALKEFIQLRAEAVRRQLSGDDTPVDTGDLNLSDMGSMGKGANRGQWTAPEGNRFPDGWGRFPEGGDQFPEEWDQFPGGRDQFPEGWNPFENGEMPDRPGRWKEQQ